MASQKDLKYWEQFFQSLQMTYYSLLAAPLFVFAIAFLRAENGSKTILALNTEFETLLVSSVAIVALAGTALVFIFAKSKYKVAAQTADVNNKMVIYRKATLTKYVVLSLLQVLVVAAYSATYHNALMGVFTALLLFASFFRPELQTAKRALRMSKETFMKVNYKSNIIN